MGGYKCPVTAVIATSVHDKNPQIHLPLVSLLGLHTQYLFPQSYVSSQIAAFELTAPLTSFLCVLLFC